MSKLIKVFAAMAFILLAFATTSTTASAKRYYSTVPKALRGTWYEYNKDTYSYTKMVFSKQRFYYKLSSFKGISLYGNQFHHSNHSDLYVASKRTKRGYYKIGPRHSDDLYLKPVVIYDRGKRVHALKDMSPDMGFGTTYVYAYHYKHKALGLE